MNFLKTYEKLNTLNKELLSEKLWIAIQPKSSNNYYKFLTVEDSKKWKDDILDLLTSKRGTYKQTLDKKVLAQLIDELKAVSKSADASIYADSSNYNIVDNITSISSNKIKTLTLADRSLRQVAHNTFSALLKNNPSLDADLNKRLHNRKYLIHHINGNEEETTLDNVILIPYFANDKYDLRIANGIHSALHGASKKSLKASPVDYTTPLYYFEDGKLKEGTCVMTLML